MHTRRRGPGFEEFLLTVLLRPTRMALYSATSWKTRAYNALLEKRDAHYERK